MDNIRGKYGKIGVAIIECPFRNGFYVGEWSCKVCTYCNTVVKINSKEIMVGCAYRDLRKCTANTILDYSKINY